MNFIKKSGISILLVFILLMSTMAFTASAIEGFPFVGVITANDVNIRTAPSLSASVQSKAKKGIKVDVFAREGDWYKIGTAPGKYAYISAQYVTNTGVVSNVAYVQPSRSGNTAGGSRAVELTKQYLGVPYVYGGTSPSGFDCSGLIYYVYKQLGYSLNRTADGMLANGVPVDRANLAPGDILMFKRPGNSYVHHVGLYVGDGQMIHAPQTGDVVKYTSITTGYYNNVYYTARRIIR